MSTSQIEQQLKTPLEPINGLLNELNNESLRSSHNSVLFSFIQMLHYIDKIIGQVGRDREDIKLLLETFRELAPGYYIKCESLLLQEIKEQQELQAHLKSLLNQIGENDTNSQLRETLATQDESANVGQEYLILNFPTILQNALDKLRDEWQRLDTIVLAIETLAEDENLFQSLASVVEIAAYSVGIFDERIVIVPGRQFALYTFSYLEDFTVLTVPIYSVRAPWEWSIFWHELAGQRVRWLEKETKATEEIREGLQNIHKSYKSKKFPLGENKFGAAYLKNLFESDTLDLTDLGGFEYQYERVLASLPEVDKFKIYEHMQARGWCVDWFKELFEDSFSVLTFGPDFLIYFDDILSRHVAMDNRHPPKEIRIAVAKELLDLATPPDLGKANSEELSISDLQESSDYDKVVIKIVAKQITKYTSLVSIASTRKILAELENLATFDRNSSLQAQENAALGTFFLLFDFENDYKKIREKIQNSISQWSASVMKKENPIRFALPNNNDISNFIIGSKKNFVPIEPKARYEELLEEMNTYRQLLDLSFYEVDFGTATVTNVFYRTDHKFSEAKLSSVPSEVTGGDVRYVDNNQKKRTTIQFWNVAAAPGYTIN